MAKRFLKQDLHSNSLQGLVVSFMKNNFIFYILLFIICVLYLVLRSHSGFAYIHPDEPIAVRVIQNIQDTGEWDTNWRLANLPNDFKIDQYNFSSYMVLSAILIKLIPLNEAISRYDYINLVLILRLLSVFFQVLTIVMTYKIGKSLFASRRVGVAASVTVALFPLMYQDSLYARPESFAAFLVLLVVLLAIGQYRKTSHLQFMVMAGLIGFLIACKISFLVLLAFPVGILGRNYQASIYKNLALIGMLCTGLIIGFFAGAPYAPLNWSSYMSGIRSLLSQYNGGQPPHGLPDGNLSDRLRYALGYFSSIGEGLFVLLAIGGILLLLKDKLYAFFIYACLFFAIIIYFSSKPLFFERNFSFSIPILSICVCYCILWCIERAKLGIPYKNILFAIIIIAINIMPFLFIYDFNKRIMSGEYQLQRDYVKQNLSLQYGSPVIDLGWVLTDSALKSNMINTFSKEDKTFIIEIFGANDKYSRHCVDLAVQEFGLRLVAELPSPFESYQMPPSTFYTYHAPHYYYLLVPQSIRGTPEIHNSIQGP